MGATVTNDKVSLESADSGYVGRKFGDFTTITREDKEIPVGVTKHEVCFDVITRAEESNNFAIDLDRLIKFYRDRASMTLEEINSKDDKKQDSKQKSKAVPAPASDQKKD